MRRYIILLMLIGYIVSDCYAQTQSREELERKRRETQEIINTTTKLLEQASTTRQSSIEHLNLINRRLELRRSLLRTIESEMNAIDRSISDGQNRIIKLESELGEAKGSYAKLIRIAYRQRMSHQRLMFILSASDFNQAYRRIKYLQQYSRSRQNQIDLIQALSQEIADEITDLEAQRDEKVVLLAQRRNEANELSNESRQQNSVVQQLQRRENQLKQELASQQKIARDLQYAIEKLIREESTVADGRVIYELTPEERIISDQFQLNKGGLPWPIERGVVTGFFGEHAHPVLKGIKVQNNGIDISTVEDAEVRSIFNGTVRQVLTVLGSNNVVLIRHGNFLSVYANLSHVYVRQGDEITTKQLIGRVFTDNDENNSILHLEIWEENEKLDPLLWLSSQ